MGGSLNPLKLVKNIISPKIPEYKPPQIVYQQPAPSPVVPTQDTAAEDIAKATAEDEKKRKTQKGRAATILSGGAGTILGDDGIATRKLTGG